MVEFGNWWEPTNGTLSFYEYRFSGGDIRQWRIQDFPEVGAPTPRGAPTYDFAKISQKLHEIERIWTPRGGAHPKFYYVDPPLRDDIVGDSQPYFVTEFVLNVLHSLTAGIQKLLECRPKYKFT